MKKLIWLFLCLCHFTSKAQNIVAAEYFVDTDPGTGNGIPINVGTSGTTVNFTASVATSSLPPGFHIVSIRSKDANGTWGLYESRGFYISNSTTNNGNITAAEYFIDADPGVGNGTAVNVGAAGTTVNFAVTVPTNSLSPGFHTLSIRTKDASGIWGLFETRGLYIFTSTTNVGNIVAAEYFIDADPGIGNATPLNIGSSGATVNFSTSIPTNSLTPGFHSIAIRTKDANGKWGLFETRGFYISTSATNVGNIVAAEYFIDTDPGLGNGTALNVGASGETVNFNASVPTTSLSPGFHTIAIRTKDANGKWGLFDTRGFYVSASTTNAGNIVAAEYFIDTDPGAGNGTALNIGSAGTTVNFVASVPTNSWSQGFHSLAIRTRDVPGKWGLADVRGFYVSASTANMARISAAEYFIDTDPGVGNGSPLTVTNPGTDVNETFAANVPAGTSQGEHLLVIRTRDENGICGLFEARPFTVSGTLPLHWITFSGSRINDKVNLKWVTENETNTSHFIIERSSNSIDFNEIGRTKAATGLRNNYSFNDPRPNQGVNFYRLKQVDMDGKFAYSQIIKILWEDNSMTLKFYPNPVKSNLFADYTGKGEKVIIHIYDAAGRFVQSSLVKNQKPLNIAVPAMAKGSYWITISDGITLQKGKFVKD